jgi:hypothetical protein
MEFNLIRLPGDMIHVSGLCGEDAGVVKLNVVFQGYYDPPRLTYPEIPDEYDIDTITLFLFI